jgi:putative lipoic acid-binding regulatory protein
VRLTQQFDADFSEKRVQIRVSSGAKYMSLTLTVKATSRTQLDDLYRALTSHPLVKYVL